MRRRGFTLIEVMIVVGIIAILAALGFMGVTRHSDKTRVQKAARDLAQHVAQARSIAETVGPRINTALLTVNGCTGGPTNAISIVIDPTTQQYFAPETVTYDAATDSMTVECRTYDINGSFVLSVTRGLGTLVTANGGPLVFSFASTGRLITGTGPNATTPANPVDWHFEIVRTGIAHERYGYRLLQSGIICRSSYPAAIQCNED